MEAQRLRLFASGAWETLPFEQLRHFPRFSKAMAVRAERLTANYQRDQSQQTLLDGLREPLDALPTEVPHALILSLSVRQYWFMLEEFAVSLYAQHLGTSMPVSEKRLRAQWETVERWTLASGGRVPE